VHIAANGKRVRVDTFAAEIDYSQAVA